MTDKARATERRMENEFLVALTGAVDACLWSTHPTPANGHETGPEYADELFITRPEMHKLRGTIAHHMRVWFLENYAFIRQATGGDYDFWDAGRDFWLTSQGHGSGFWDRGLGAVGDALTDSADGYGDIVGLNLDAEGVQVLVDPYNVQTFADGLFRNGN